MQAPSAAGNPLLRETRFCGAALRRATSCSAFTTAPTRAPAASSLADLEREQLRLADGDHLARRRHARPLSPLLPPFRCPQRCGSGLRSTARTSRRQSRPRPGRAAADPLRRPIAALQGRDSTWPRRCLQVAPRGLGADDDRRRHSDGADGPVDADDRRGGLRRRPAGNARGCRLLWGPAATLRRARPARRPLSVRGLVERDDGGDASRPPRFSRRRSGARRSWSSPGVTGWLTDGIGPAAVQRGLLRLLEDREEVCEQLRASGAIFERFLRLADPEPILAGYERAARLRSTRASRAAAAAAEEPLVTGVVPVLPRLGYVEEAVGSLLAQTHREPRGPGRQRRLLRTGRRGARAARRRSAGARRQPAERRRVLGPEPGRTAGPRRVRGDARRRQRARAGVRRSRPGVVRRGARARLRLLLAAVRRPRRLAVLRTRPATRRSETGWCATTAKTGTATPSPCSPAQALRRARLCATSPSAAIQSDWELYRWLREDGRFGVVIPELLVRVPGPGRIG